MVFFSCCHGAPRALHSFPTRRSSDLDSRSKEAEPSPPPKESHLAPPESRSEEHTSELQSHLNLVCRLLLEKKKAFESVVLLSKTAKRVLVMTCSASLRPVQARGCTWV